MEKVIIDGDWGGDEMQLAAVLLANRNKVSVLGATCVFGNTSEPQVCRNALGILNFLYAANIPVYSGLKASTNQPAPPEGDNAHGENGLGGVKLSHARAIQSEPAVDFILETLRREPAHSVTVTATGPLSNIAACLQQDPEAMARVKRIVIMGGCTEAMPAADMPMRQGNITPYAEFNFYMASADADRVVRSGLPIVLMPMNCTQQLALTPGRAGSIRRALLPHLVDAEAVIGMMSAPAELDRLKFDSAPFMHDVHTALYILHPKLYETRRGFVRVVPSGETQGHSLFGHDELGTTTVATAPKDPERLFGHVVRALATQLVKQPEQARLHYLTAGAQPG